MLDMNNVYFNSTMVRLKDNSKLVSFIVRVNFNSTMVRLKEQVEAHWNVSVSFQFHYGTIKSPVTPL